MASIAAMPPTPQQSFSHMAPANSPPGPASQPPPISSYPPSYSMSFDSQHSAPISNTQPVYPQSYPNGPISNPGYARSFGDGYGMRAYGEKPQIYTVSLPMGQPERGGCG